LKDSGLKPLEYVYDHYIGLAFASIIFSYAISVAVYMGSFQPNKLLALGGNTGNAIYDVSTTRLFMLAEFNVNIFILTLVHDW
jgi:hypothetical protein